ncbi:ATP-binding protein [Clostridium perfringens]|uniref:Uncharacterized protein n=1 Tax=Clostridium perfringens TaxID=1502 RepID=A0A140GS39_CLOPF|nr:ATP-binding protein [Clostridium perfringens]AMN31348.1 hypothetical protein JFP838_pA0432 [Clostridium perfringens]
MKIKSDTKGKIKKIIKGNVFDKKTFISELFQNSIRANSKEIHINLYDNLFSFEDNGVGLKKADDLLTFDTSSWETTNEGFGIGFWSVLSIPNIETISISSLKKRIYIDIDKMLCDLSVDYKEVESPINGFKVVLKSDYFKNDFEDIVKTIKNIGRFMVADVFFNGELIEKKEIFEEYAPKRYDFSKEYSNKLFSARFFIDKDLYKSYMFYENRFVCRAFPDYGMSFIVKFKDSSITLKEPDRKSVVEDEKYDIFIEKLYGLKKQFLRDYIKNCSENNIDFSDNCKLISEYLEVKDYKRFLTISEKEAKITGLDALKSDNSDKPLTKERILSVLNCPGEDGIWSCTKSELISDEDYFDDSISNVTKCTLDKIDSNTKKVIINGDLYEKKTLNSNSYENEVTEKASSGVITIEKYLGSKKVFWVSANEVDKFNTEIALAEYYGIEVIKSKNVLYDKFFESKGLPEISEIRDILKFEHKFDNLGSKNNKESNFLLLLDAVRIKYNLKENVFNLADISCVVNYKQDGEYKKIKTLKNTTKKIEVYGCKFRDEIILDRKAISLKDFNLNISPQNYKLGVHEYRCIMNVVDTLAHELAHYIYNTSDNTNNHFKIENRLRKEIIDMYLNLK